MTAPSAESLGVLSETRPNGTALGLYLHVPFCVKKCYFCSFNTAPLDRDAMTRFLRALDAEIQLVAAVPWARDVSIETVFLGGGTPSLLPGDAMAAILGRLRQRLRLSRGAEITVECTPESVDVPKLTAYREAGVTRISLGVEALDDTILTAIGRLHDARAARTAFDACRAVGFDSISVDLMYGLPALDADGWTRTVRTVLAWAPDHLSAYGLTLDKGSLWGATGGPALPPEDTVVEQYWALARAAAEHGFEHYEISNYARPGHRSRHNQVYWRREEYLALGPGACGFVGDVRYANAKAVPRYAAALEDGALPIETFERVTPDQALAETLFLALRTSDGASHDALERRVMRTPALRRRLDAWIADGLMEVDGPGVHLTERGFLVSDALFVELL